MGGGAQRHRPAGLVAVSQSGERDREGLCEHRGAPRRQQHGVPRRSALRGTALDSLRGRAAHQRRHHGTRGATGLVATPGSRSVTLDWVDNAETDLAGYRVERRVGNRAWSVRADVSTSAFTDIALKSGTTYRYRVSAYDRNGNYSLPSAEVAAVPTR